MNEFDQLPIEYTNQDETPYVYEEIMERMVNLKWLKS